MTNCTQTSPSSQTSVTSAVAATVLRSSISTPVARALLGKGVCGDSPVAALHSESPAIWASLVTGVFPPDVSPRAEHIALVVDDNGIPADDDGATSGSSGRDRPLVVSWLFCASVPALDANPGVVPSELCDGSG